MDLHWSLRPRVKGEAALHARAHASAPAQLGHQTVALPELRLEREVVAMEAMVVRGAIEELQTRMEIRRVLGRGGNRSWRLRYGDDVIGSPSARARDKLALR